MTNKVLIVDDDQYTLTLLDGLFRGGRATIRMARTADEARRCFREEEFNLILMDQRLPDGNGLDLLKEMRAERPRQMAILITAYADVRDAVRAVREGLFDYLTKPFENLEELEAVTERALELDRAYREIDSLRATLREGDSAPMMIGTSPQMENFLQQIKQVAPLDVSVLLEGESGTGKDLAARLLHSLSPRRDNRFLCVNCGALSEQLLESTLFGYDKGAFTGAAKNTPGLLEEADGGTLFLDEIADMSTKLQSSLLTALQEHTFCRLGSSTLRNSDFRLVCATNKQLSNEVKEQRFREDLYYRINVVAFKIPPLRERKGDVFRLANHFLTHFNSKFGKNVGPFAPDAIHLMERFPWPGNVRQLGHAIERIVALHDDGSIGATDFADLQDVLHPDGEAGGTARAYRDERAQFERDYMRRLLRDAEGNMSEAARLSGVSRQNLYVRMKRWNLS